MNRDNDDGLQDDDMLALLNLLQDYCKRDDDLVAQMLTFSLSFHMHSCGDLRIAEKVVHYLDASISDLFGSVNEQPVVSQSVH
jgi:hypothetical protein